MTLGRYAHSLMAWQRRRPSPMCRLNQASTSFFSSFSSSDDDDRDDKPSSSSPYGIIDIISSVEALDADSSSSTLSNATTVLPSHDSSLATVGGNKFLNVPQVLVLSTPRRPLFPGSLLPMMIHDPVLSRSILSLKEAGTPYLGVFLKKRSSTTTPLAEEDDSGDDVTSITHVDQIHSVGTFARFEIMSNPNTPRHEDESLQLVLNSHRRIRITDTFDAGPPLRASIVNMENDPTFDPTCKFIIAYCNEIIANLRELASVNPMFKDNAQYFNIRFNDVAKNPLKLADFAATVVNGHPDDLQALLAEPEVTKRLEMTLEAVRKELELALVQQKIKQDVDEKMTASHRKFLLMEHLKTIKKELGMEVDDKDALVTTFQEKFDVCAPHMSTEASKAFAEELAKFKVLEKNSSEFNVTRTYLEWLGHMPWTPTPVEPIALTEASEVLNAHHYGLEDIKERILEFIAVSLLKENVEGKILCFVGPPGTGKTSIGKSIAKALKREFYRFSVGGLTDVAEIKGHRRTYVGAMPGKIIQCLKTTASSNPVILIDEIDKLGRGHTGDPASALLELLDPSQNKTFVDHYLDVPMDLSKVLFICTANVLDTIPGPLQDRMEMIRLSGYDAPEKVAITTQFLIPKAQTSTGLTPSHPLTPPDFSLSTSAIEHLIRRYCREAGVRQLDQMVEKIYRKVAYAVVKASERRPEDHESPPKALSVLEPDDLEHYLGQPKFVSDRMYEEDLVPGVVMGLAWTSMGGATLYIETTTTSAAAAGKGTLLTTGQMGNVMEESTKIAHTFARHFALTLDTDASTQAYLSSTDVHMHIPEGATPKDGPSAGITMTTALLSLALNRAILPNLAMTGEMSLTGKVLPVGGIKEKVIAARRAGVNTLIVPAGNAADVTALPSYLTNDLTVHLANTYADVYAIAFP